MPTARTHEIVLRGRIARRLLGPFVDEFTVDHDRPGVTRLVGSVRDSSHLHGLVAYLASMNAELISVTHIDSTITSNSNPNTNSTRSTS
jgi:hypothetical protein